MCGYLTGKVWYYNLLGGLKIVWSKAYFHLLSTMHKCGRVSHSFVPNFLIHHFMIIFYFVFIFVTIILFINILLMQPSYMRDATAC